MLRKAMMGALASLAILFGAIFGAMSLSGEVWATDDLCGDTSIDVELRKTAGCEETGTVKKPIVKIVNLILYAGGALSVVMVIYAGMQMSLSAGDSGKVTKARMILIYAVAGLAICILAYTIVNFVIGKVS